MITQKIERFSIGKDLDAIDTALGSISDRLKNGWLVKHIIKTDDTSDRWPQLVVVFEKESEQQSTESKNID